MAVAALTGKTANLASTFAAWPALRFGRQHLLLASAVVWMLGLGVSFPAHAADLAEVDRLFRGGKYAECADRAANGIAAGEISENWPLYKLKAELALGRYPEALKTLDAALLRFPASLQLRWLGREACRCNNQPERAQKLLDEIGMLVQRSSWQYRDAANRVLLGHFFLEQGIDAKKVLDVIYDEIKKQQPDYAGAYLASGELALEKNDFALAAEAYQQAVKLDPGDADAQLGLARAFAPSDPDKAKAALTAALTANPSHIDSLLYLVDDHIDAERYQDAAEALDRVAQVNPEHPLLWAYRALLAHFNNDEEEAVRRHQAALKWYPANPQVDWLIGKKLSQKYRFAEGAACQRQALQLDSAYLPAKIQLAQDLLRLGDEQAGWPLAEEVNQQDGYNVVAHNLVTLQDSLRKFRTLESDGFVLRMDEKEAAIYGQRVLDLLHRARQTLCAKYDVTVDEPVIVELFPRQQDFAIRTFGLPGGAGFLGVCFGRVITANSPASQGENPSNWEATLWHEFCHVVTLHKTHNKMPRWLSEGISVYEERQADPTWGQSINPHYREMMLGDELTPVSELSGAFLHPKSPRHLQFAYFESSLVVEHLVEKYGLETLKRILVDLGVGMPINDSLARYAGSLEALDQEFAEFARQRANAMAPKADWSEPDLPPTAKAVELAGWVEKHPQNYRALARLARQRISDKQWAEAKAPLMTMLELYPDSAGGENVYSMLAKVHRELGEQNQERSVLEKLAAISADDVEAFSRLMELASLASDWPAAIKYGNRLLAVNPLKKAPYRQLAAAAEKTASDALAIESYRALLRLDPIDPADLHYQLATHLRRQGDLSDAKRHALEALEEAPRYRAAQRELLAIVRQIDENESKRESEPAADTGSSPAAERGAEAKKPDPSPSQATDPSEPSNLRSPRR
jgi:tetratricopeptide (TPR) repeat protein